MEAHVAARGDRSLDLTLYLRLAQAISIFVLMAFVAARSGLLVRILARAQRWGERLTLVGMTGLLGIVGTYWGVPVEGALANTRVVGPMLAGLMGGPVAGLAAGLLAGLHRLTLGGFTGVACGVSTTCEGLLAGMVHHHLKRRNREITAPVAFAATAAAEMLQMLIILLLARPFTDALHLVERIALPMILVNATGVGLMVGIVRDSQRQKDRLQALQAQTVLEIASRTLPHLREGLTEASALATCRIVLELTDMGSVTMTSRDRILAFVGAGEDHHRPGIRPLNQVTWEVLNDGRARVVLSRADVGCTEEGCPLAAGVVVPLRDGDQVVGSLSLYQKGSGPVTQVTLELALGLGHLLSTQIELSRAQAMKQLLAQAELRALQAQINPHFLFNALGTIGALCRRDPNKARELIVLLSHYMRASIRSGSERVTLAEELGYVEAFLAIQHARFGPRLRSEVAIDPELMNAAVPILSLQPLVENSVRHGIMPRAEGGFIRLTGHREGSRLVLTVTDDGVGMTAEALEAPKGTGVGLSNVRQRLRYLYGSEGLVELESSPGKGTTVRLRLPLTLLEGAATGSKMDEEEVELVGPVCTGRG